MPPMLHVRDIVRSVAISCVVLGCATSAPPDAAEARGKGYATSIDFTELAPWSIKSESGLVQRLRTVHPNVAPQYIAGHYSVDLFAHHGGRSIYLFPNHEYAIAHELGASDEMLAELGTWSFADGKVTLQPAADDPSTLELLDGILRSVRESIGDYRSLRFFVTVQGEEIDRSVMVTEDSLRTADGMRVWPLIRQEEYIDWPSHLQRIKSQRLTRGF